MKIKETQQQRAFNRRETRWRREGRKRERQRRNEAKLSRSHEETIETSINFDDKPKSLRLHSSQIITASAAPITKDNGENDAASSSASSTSSDSTSSSSSSSSSSSDCDSVKEPLSPEGQEKANIASSVSSSRDDMTIGDVDSLPGGYIEPLDLDFEDAFTSGPELGGQSGDDMLGDRSNTQDRNDKVLTDVPDMEDLDDLETAERLGSEKGRGVQRRRRRRMYRDDKAPFVLEIDDETDEDFLSVLLDKKLPPGIRLCTAQHMPDFGTGSGGKAFEAVDGQMVISMLRFQWNPAALRGTRSNQFFTSLFQELFAKLCAQLTNVSPAIVCGVRTQVNLTPDDMIELICTGKVLVERKDKGTPKIEENGDSDSTLLDELEIRRREDAEQREVSRRVESGVASMMLGGPSVSQNRATVIVDRLSDEMKRLHLGECTTDRKESQSNKPKSSRSSPPTKPLLAAPGPHSIASTMPGSPKSRTLGDILSPRPFLGGRNKTEGSSPGSSSSPSTPTSLALNLFKNAPIGQFVPSLKQPSLPSLQQPLPSQPFPLSGTKATEVPVEISPLHHITNAKVRSMYPLSDPLGMFFHGVVWSYIV